MSPEAPLTAQQEHLVQSREFFSRSGRSLSPSLVPCVLRIRGDLAERTIEDALNRLLGRHAALRAYIVETSGLGNDERSRALAEFATTGVFRPGLYRQVVLPYTPIRLVDGKTSGAAESPSFFSATLCSTEAGEQLITLAVDHLATDAWSMQLIRREFAEFCLHPDSEGSEAGLSGVDYAVRQDQMMRNGDFAPHLGYWTRIWRDFGPYRLGPANLPFDPPSAPSPAYAFRSETDRFDSELSAFLRIFARRKRVTLHTVLLTAFAICLRRYAQLDRIALWCHFANRNDPETRSSVGWFATTHLIGIDFTGNPSTTELLLRTRRTVLSAIEFQALPAPLVWRAMGYYPNDPDARVLFDFSHVDISVPPSQGISISHAPELTPPFGRAANIGLYVRDHGNLHLCVQYRCDRLSAASATRILSDFRSATMLILNGPGDCSP